MQKLAAGLFLAGIFAVSLQAAPADTMMSHPMMMPTCAAGDPVVGVNTMSKMYMTQAQMKAKMDGMTPAQKSAMMTKNHVKMMCKSKADAMGAKMMKPM